MIRVTRFRRSVGVAAAVAALAGCGADPVPLRLIGPAARNLPRTAEVQLDIPYIQRGDQVLRLDLYRPAGAAGWIGSAAPPVVVILHGGSWRSGSKTDVAEYAYDLAANGFAGAAVEYRLVGREAVFPAQVADVLAAIRFLRDHGAELGIDPARIATMGLSAGGHLALMAGLCTDASLFDAERPSGEPSGVVAIVDLFGPTDFTVDPATVSPDLVRIVERFLGTTLAEDADGVIRRMASPTTYVHNGGPPVLIIHGTADATVPVDQAHRLAAALDAVGQKHQLLEMPGMGHVDGAIWYGPAARTYRLPLLAFLAGNL